MGLQRENRLGAEHKACRHGTARLFPELLLRAGSEFAGAMNYLNVALEGNPLMAEALRRAAHWNKAEVERLLEWVELFPQQFLTFEAFAAAAMTEWLLYPAELGYEPAALALVAQAEGLKDGGPVIMCLWKFVNEEGQAFAAASGSYPINRPAEPLWGQDTFSNFTEWDSLSAPEETIAAIRSFLGRDSSHGNER
jgi:hypothetical protein